MSDEIDALRTVAKAAEEAVIHAKVTDDWKGDYWIRKDDHDRLWDALVAWKRIASNSDDAGTRG